MRQLSEHDVVTWVQDTLLSPDRDRAIVAVTSHPRTDRAWIEPEELAESLGDLADVVFLETGDATWALSECLPPRLDAYGGAIRIWWPKLTMESNPYDHRLYFMQSAMEAKRVFRQIVTSIRAAAGHSSIPSGPRRSPSSLPLDPPRELPATAPASTASAPPEVILDPPETVRVVAVSSDQIEVSSSTRRGVLIDAELPMSLMIECLDENTQFEAQPMRARDDGTWEYSTVGLLPNPWERLVSEVSRGDVVLARVQNLLEDKRLVFVDVLPGVVGVCHISELDYGYVAKMSEFVRRGQLRPFQVLEIDDATLSIQLSLKRAYGQQARSLPALVEGGPLFEWREDMPMFESLRRMRAKTDADSIPRIHTLGRITPPPTDLDEDDDNEYGDDQQESLEKELAAERAERANLVTQIRQLRTRLQEEKKSHRAAEERIRELERRTAMEDPLSSERAFVRGVRMCYASKVDEDDRQRSPLQKMRVGRSFLASVVATEGVELEKILDVCAQVAANTAHTITGRELHPLRVGSRGADSRVRSRDGAQAWRCALQVGTPSARRLHWWNVPGKNGATIEFACIGLHDSFDIPEE